MPVELKVPAVGESITEVEVGEWLKSEGEGVARDEAVAMIESEKASVEVTAPVAGTLTRILKRQGEKARVGEVIGHMEAGAARAEEPRRPSPSPAASGKAPAPPDASRDRRDPGDKPRRPRQPEPQRVEEKPRTAVPSAPGPAPGEATTPEDTTPEATTPEATTPEDTTPEDTTPEAAEAGGEPAREPRSHGRGEEAVPMSPIRRSIARRLVEAQNTAAILTTFNEIDMSAVKALRQELQEGFQLAHGIKLGFMSFFVKASIEALKHVPQVNAEIRGDDIVYHKYHDIGIAVGGGKGLVVPVLRDADRLSFAEIEKRIDDFARRAQANQLKVEELRGGTFTISNGGVYGSLLSTPILNPPQSGILGLHAIQDRPVARDGAVVIRPMMYVALSYDHRLIDGKEAVTFLKQIKEQLELPMRLMMDV